jgi:hypothetical protein
LRAATSAIDDNDNAGTLGLLPLVGCPSSFNGSRCTVHRERGPENVELELRVSRVEILLKDVRVAIEALNKRAVAMQAQLDHLDARLGRR